MGLGCEFDASCAAKLSAIDSLESISRPRRCVEFRGSCCPEGKGWIGRHLRFPSQALIGIGRAFEQPRPLALLRLSWSGAQRPRDAVSRGLAAYDLRLHVTARIAFVRAQVGAIVVRQALEADEARLQPAQFAARRRQCSKRPSVRREARDFDLLGHVELTHARSGKATAKPNFYSDFNGLLCTKGFF